MALSMSQVDSGFDPGDIGWNALRGRLGGDLVRPNEAGYDEGRRVFNGMFDRYPAAIAYCTSAADVSAVIRFARDHGLPISVRSGGHGITGAAVIDNALTIDCSRMKDITVDAERRMARVGAGLRLGELETGVEAFGFVSPTGTASDTGMAGLTLGAGYGFLNGSYGLAIDNVLGAEIVVADGQVLQVSATEHPDLFWAIRGGGGNFGVVTRFDLQLHPLQQVLSGLVLYPYAMARDFLRHYREVAANAPDQLTTYAAMVPTPDGTRLVGAMTCWSGPMAEGEASIAPLRAFGMPVVDTIQPMPYSVVNTLSEAVMPSGLRHYWKQRFLRDLADEAIDTILAFVDRVPSNFTALVIDQVHGAARRVAPDATAFPHRDYPHSLVMTSCWQDSTDDEQNIAWTRELAAALTPWSTGGAYVNEAWDEPARAAFGQNWNHLRDIKTRYDPTNVFRFNTNIPPWPTSEG